MELITRRFAALIACFAILFAAFAPSISHAVAAARGQAWVEVCSVGGAKFVKVGSDQGDSLSQDTQQSLSHEHCPICATHGGSFALPPGADATVALFVAQDSQPFLFLQSPHPLPIWTAAQSRAPPVLA
jgi:hypothetical protein